MEITIHIQRWDVGTVRASQAINGRGSLAAVTETNPVDFLDYLTLLSSALRVGDRMVLFLPPPAQRMGLDRTLTPRLQHLLARGVECAAQTRDGHLRWVPEVTATPTLLEDDALAAVLPDPLPGVCDDSGDVGSRHVWAPGAFVGEWCRCGRRRKHFLSMSPQPEASA